VARAPRSRLVLEKCRLSTEWEIIDQNGKVATDVPYFVMRVQGYDKKGNFARIPSIRDAYAKLHDASVKGDEKTAKEAFEFFRRTVIWPADLHPHDRTEMIEFARKQLEESFPAQRTAAKTLRGALMASRTFPQLEQLVPWS
jgi:ribosomal protein S1